MFPLEISKHIVRESSSLTGAYVAGNVFSMSRENFLGIEVNYTKGDETSMQLKIEVSNDGGITFAQQAAESVSGGTITVNLAERSFSASGVYALAVYPIKAERVRISVKATGGTPTGACAIKAYTSWV